MNNKKRCEELVTMRVKMPEDLIQRLKAKAADEGIEVGELCTRLVENWSKRTFLCRKGVSHQSVKKTKRSK